MNIVEFHQKIEQIWDEIEEQLEAQDCDADCERQGSVFTITLGDRSQIVINKQEPLLELWLASHNGGFHLMTVHKSLSINKNPFLSFGLRAAWVVSILPIKMNVGSATTAWIFGKHSLKRSLNTVSRCSSVNESPYPIRTHEKCGGFSR